MVFALLLRKLSAPCYLSRSLQMVAYFTRCMTKITRIGSTDIYHQNYSVNNCKDIYEIITPTELLKYFSYSLGVGSSKGFKGCST